MKQRHIAGDKREALRTASPPSTRKHDGQRLTDRLRRTWTSPCSAGETPIADGQRHAALHQASVTDLIAHVADVCRAETGLDVVVLGGGVFGNALLLAAAERALTERGFTVLRPHLLPPNDGGIALGLLLIGAAG